MISDQDIIALLPRLHKIAHKIAYRHGDAFRTAMEVDDLVQEVVVSILKARERLDLPFLTCILYNMTRNIDIKNYRKLRSQKTQATDPDQIRAPDPLAHKRAIDKIAYGEFLDAFAKLSADHRDVLVALEVDCMKVNEAAIHLGIASGTVKSRASRARQQIELHMGERPYV